jgi:hypothetical protein
MLVSMVHAIYRCQYFQKKRLQVNTELLTNCHQDLEDPTICDLSHVQGKESAPYPIIYILYRKQEPTHPRRK